MLRSQVCSYERSYEHSMGRVTVISGPERRRQWSDVERKAILVAAFAPGAVVAKVALQFDVSTSLIYKWRREALKGEEPAFVPAVLQQDAPHPAQRGWADQPTAISPAIIVDLAPGRSVRISPQAPEGLVTTVLRALR